MSEEGAGERETELCAWSRLDRVRILDSVPVTAADLYLIMWIQPLRSDLDSSCILLES